MSFDKNLVDIDYQTSCIPESVSLLHPLENGFAVFLVIAGRPEVSRTEDFCFWFDSQVIMRNNPLVLDCGKLLNFVDLLVVIDGGRSGPEDADHRIYLSS